MKIRNDLLYALIAFESALIAIASILWFPVWVFAVATAVFVFSAVELILGIVKLRKTSYDEEKGYTYKFPIWVFIMFATLLILLTATVIFAIKLLFGWALLTLAALIIELLLLAILNKRHLMTIVTGVLAVLLVIFLVGYGAAHLVHLGVNLNPGLAVENVPPVDDQTPGDDIQTPGDDTQTPGDDIQTPGDDTQIPGDDTQTPGDDTQTPGDDTQTPGDDTQIPGDDTQTPGDDTQIPVVTPKINAPETMSYGVPVTITLEGIDVDNLKYGGKDFISIVKISDTQVILTLVGIVNDAGEVEFVPASGYITVTDSVSDVNVKIYIVE